MMLYDKMKNPGVPMEDIVARQVLLGASDPTVVKDTDSRSRAESSEKARMMPLLMRYAEENHDNGYAVSWSEWLAARGGSAGQQ